MGRALMPVSDVRKSLNDLLGKLDRPIFVTQRGRVKAVLMDYERYEALLDEMDDLRDACNPEIQRAFAEAEAAIKDGVEAAEARGDLVPWEQVKAELGITDDDLRSGEAADDAVQD